MSERVLSTRALNRALLARQLLLERTALPLPRALERIGGIQAQYAPSMYVGLGSRLDGFRRDALTRALKDRRVVQATLMRSTIHLVSRGDYWPLAEAVREPRRESFMRAARPRPEPRRMAAAARTARGRLARGPMRRREIEELVGRDRFRGLGVWLDMVRVPPSGTWEHRRADIFGLAEHWVGPSTTAAGEGRALLLRRYLRGFGPATRHDIASFTGLSLPQVDITLEALPVRRFRSEDGDELVDVPRAPLPDPDTPAPVRLLPTWDATLLAHARRTGVLPEEHRKEIFHVKAPQSYPTFLVDGRVAGKWRMNKAGLQLEPFGRLDAGSRRELQAEGERLTELYAGTAG
jgi:hypothetical protein